MNTNQWIEIKPGCEMPKDGEWVLIYSESGATHFCAFASPATFFNQNANSYYAPSHWMRVEPPPKPDPFEAWWWSCPTIGCVVSKGIARTIWDAAIASTKQAS